MWISKLPQHVSASSQVAQKSSVLTATYLFSKMNFSLSFVDLSNWFEALAISEDTAEMPFHTLKKCLQKFITKEKNDEIATCIIKAINYFIENTNLQGLQWLYGLSFMNILHLNIEESTCTAVHIDQRINLACARKRIQDHW